MSEHGHNGGGRHRAQRRPHVIESKLITCVLRKGEATALLKRLKAEKGITSANLNHARGAGFSGADGENDVLTVVVPADAGDEIFEFLHEAAAIDRPGGGFLSMARLAGAAEYVLPQLRELD